MFTGIIAGVGEIVGVEKRGDTRFEIGAPHDFGNLDFGASIACAGCCLTVVEKTHRTFRVDVSAETMSKTTLAAWRQGSRVNLERPLRMGDELGGHLVSGHVDGVGDIIAVAEEGGSKRFRFRVPGDLARFIAPKGSIALDGTSFTVNEVKGREFGINIIPHTLAVTTWGEACEGGRVNVEIDMLARYVARLALFKNP